MVMACGIILPMMAMTVNKYSDTMEMAAVGHGSGGELDGGGDGESQWRAAVSMATTTLTVATTTGDGGGDRRGLCHDK